MEDCSLVLILDYISRRTSHPTRMFPVGTNLHLKKNYTKIGN